MTIPLRFVGVVSDATPQDATPQDATPQDASPQDATAQNAIVQNATAQNAIVQNATTQNAIVQQATAQNAIVQKATAQNAIVQKATAQNAIVHDAPARHAPARHAPARHAPARHATRRSTRAGGVRKGARIVRHACAVLAFGMALACTLHAQEVRVSITPDSLHYRIGEWIHVDVKVDAPQNAKLELPARSGDFGPAELVASDQAGQSVENGRLHVKRSYTVSLFDAGKTELRARVTYRIGGDTTRREAWSDPVTMTITGVDIDTTKSFRDITDVRDVPLAWWQWLLIIGGVLVAAAVVWYGWRWWKRRKERAGDAIPAEPSIPPYDEAIARLRVIESTHAHERGEHKTWQSEITDAVRTYIERAHGVPALEQTTHEIIAGMAVTGFPPDVVLRLEEMLRRADMTKFARYIPSRDEHLATLATAYEFLECGHARERTAANAEQEKADGGDARTGRAVDFAHEGNSAAGSMGRARERDQ